MKHHLCEKTPCFERPCPLRCWVPVIVGKFEPKPKLSYWIINTIQINIRFNTWTYRGSWWYLGEPQQMSIILLVVKNCLFFNLGNFNIITDQRTMSSLFYYLYLSGKLVMVRNGKGGNVFETHFCSFFSSCLKEGFLMGQCFHDKMEWLLFPEPKPRWLHQKEVLNWGHFSPLLKPSWRKASSTGRSMSSNLAITLGEEVLANLLPIAESIKTGQPFSVFAGLYLYSQKGKELENTQTNELTNVQ